MMGHETDFDHISPYPADGDGHRSGFAAVAETMPPSWRFQGAYLLTILIYLLIAIAFMSVLGLIALIGRRYLPERRQNSR
jgi:hypothetical protein